jgi:hypothetical protein
VALFLAVLIWLLRSGKFKGCILVGYHLGVVAADRRVVSLTRPARLSALYDAMRVFIDKSAGTSHSPSAKAQDMSIPTMQKVWHGDLPLLL